MSKAEFALICLLFSSKMQFLLGAAEAIRSPVETPGCCITLDACWTTFWAREATTFTAVREARSNLKMLSFCRRQICLSAKARVKRKFLQQKYVSYVVIYFMVLYISCIVMQKRKHNVRHVSFACFAAKSTKDHSEVEPTSLSERDLFLWSVLLNRREMALMFWRSGQDQIGKKKEAK